MQRWRAKVRSLFLNSAIPRPSPSGPQINRLVLSSESPRTFAVIYSNFKPLITSLISATHTLPRNDFGYSHSSLYVRHFSATSKEKKWKKMTPETSKVKKIKMKTYSSYKGRFRTLNDGSIRRWREGKRHNAHLKSKKAKRRLRRPAIVPLAYAKVMKKLHFCG
ncbi:hypothetical protein Nepgr_011005 [Nepenthes gracilis]|uniref:50S ribosomal protein L35 n=1 Tax=Nepenthes gracilis TaxID=150966 RepID=A0AAD3XLW1_NEPGR|nr:hypothetical protein Nepgr_011005 [Nepenthes gracilis]